MLNEHAELRFKINCQRIKLPKKSKDMILLGSMTKAFSSTLCVRTVWLEFNKLITYRTIYL